MKKYLIYCVFAMAVFGCSNQKHGESADAAVGLEVSDSTLASKIIKTADMRFRVKDVQDTKEKISQAVQTSAGHVVEFNIQSNIVKTEKVRHSADSLLELTAYRKEGAVTAKIPSDKLDEFTNKVAKMAVFVDNQSLKLDDQSVAYLSNSLKSNNRVEAVTQLKKHASKKSNNVETAVNLKDDYIDRKMQNLEIDGKVAYSTIILNFYQDNTVSRLVVGNDNLYDHRPGFFTRFALNIQDGWTIFKEGILLITNLWMIILVGIAIVFGYKYYRKRKVKTVAL